MLHRIAIVIALAMWTASAALAADKGGPVPYQAPAQAAPAGTVVEPAHFAGLYLEGSVAAANFKAAEIGTDSFGLIGLGIGYDHRLSASALGTTSIIGGVFARYDLGREDYRALTLGGRLGVTLNPHLLLYLPVEYTMDGENIDLKNGIWSAGIGLETALLTNKLAIFGQITRNFSLAGDAQWLDEAYFFRAGLKWRF